MHRHSTYSVEEIFGLMEARAVGGPLAVTPEGHKLKVSSDRLRLFKEKGLGCVSCPLVGIFFALEDHNGETPHLNLYGVTEKGREVMMTKDHIRPKAKGGRNEMANYQPMCADCNGKKADKY